MIKVWLPLNKDFRNVGLVEYNEPTSSSISLSNGSPFDDNGKCSYGGLVYHIEESDFDNEFTIATWGKWASFTQSNDIISCKSDASYQPNQWYLSLTTNGTKLNIAFNSTASSSYAAAYTFSVNTWYHIAATYNGVTGKYALYVNGGCIGSGTSVTAKKIGCNNVGIGCRSNSTAGTSIAQSGSYPYLSDFRIYNHELRGWEIKDIANKKSFEVYGGLFLEKTDNISASKILTDTAYNGSLSKYGYNNTSNLKKETVVVDGVECDKVTIRSGNTAVYPYVFFSPLHPASGSWKTVSFDYYPTTQNCLIPYTYGGSAGAIWISNYALSGGNTTPGSSRTIPVNVGEWNHVSLSLLGTSSATTGWGYFRIGSAAHTGNISNYWLFKNVQIEEKDHPTPRTHSHRDDRAANVANFNHDITPYNVVKSGSTFYFNGTDSAIQVPIKDIITGGTWTINLWFYRSSGQWGSKSWETLIGGPSGFELSSKNSGSNTPQIRTYSWTNSGYTYEYDRWNMVTLSRTPSGAKCYLNSELKHNGTAGSLPNGDYYIGAWKTATQQNFRGYIRDFAVYKKELSQEDITNLYNRG